ncbi:Lrp/AsnC family transcriptional regulator [Parvularcula oceani]|uniref:Lrp/AsnC family transcriptional regulator n=1 Tax=Parvularcula oceani TaxID=1247963 RepID=UPI0004E25ACA|nr:Lrp/AsnC family transcriptional regulator [Parvularcula oceani]
MAEAIALDRIDRAILRRLQADGRITNQKLAEAVALSPSACLARTRRLEAAGVIIGYHAKLRAARIGASLTVFAEVTLSTHELSEVRRVERHLAELPEACEIAQVSGPYDYLARFVVPSMEGWTQLADTLTDGELCISKITTVVQMKSLKPFTAIPV